MGISDSVSHILVIRGISCGMRGMGSRIALWTLVLHCIRSTGLTSSQKKFHVRNQPEECVFLDSRRMKLKAPCCFTIEDRTLSTVLFINFSADLKFSVVITIL